MEDYQKNVASSIDTTKDPGLKVGSKAAPQPPKANTSKIPAQNPVKPAAPKTPAAPATPAAKNPQVDQNGLPLTAPDWIGDGKLPAPKEKQNEAVDKMVGETPDRITPVDSQGSIADGEKKANEAAEEYSKSQDALKETYKESLATTTKVAEDKYAAEVQILNEALALQQQLAAQQTALISSAGDIQKQEAKNAYEANQRAVELQKKKVAEAYESMKIEQELLNKQRRVREETALGLIYGGFGSVAANKNLEETIMQGEREIVKLKQEAVNKDTEFQNQVVELNSAYELDLRKIEQWKAEEQNKVYSELQRYVQEIKSDKMMAAAEKAAAINQAVSGYNERVAEISASVAQTKFDLSLSLIERADNLRQQELENKYVAEDRKVSAEERERKKNIEDLDLLLSNYSTSEWKDLPTEVQIRMNDISKSLNMPPDFAEKAFETYKEATETQEVPEFKFFTDNNGNVTAVTYDPDKQAFTSISLGGVSKGDTSKWSTTKDEDGNVVLYNTSTGQTRTGSSLGGGVGGGVGAALAVPDGSHGGQCGAFVNDYTGLNLGDAYEDKLSQMNPNITEPQAGDVFVMPYSWTGHTGFIDSIKGGKAIVKDSNWDLDEKVQTHEVDIADMTGFWRPAGKASGAVAASFELGGAPAAKVTPSGSTGSGTKTFKPLF